MERVLTGKPRRAGAPLAEPNGDGGDSPAWSRKRGVYQPPDVARTGTVLSRMPSCMRIRHTASSTVPARRRNSSRRPPGWIFGRSR